MARMARTEGELMSYWEWKQRQLSSQCDWSDMIAALIAEVHRDRLAMRLARHLEDDPPWEPE